MYVREAQVVALCDTDEARLRRAEAALKTGYEEQADQAEAEPGAKPYLHRSMVALLDGSLLCTYYSHRQGQAKYHAGLLRSTDQGKTWQYFTDIAYDAKAPGEGYCEPALIRLADGALLAMLRTGSSTPMFQTRSTDDGKTWSRPEQVMGHGVCPDLCVMENGVLVCSSGRPNAGIMFSYDGRGRKWEDAQDIYRARGSHYTTVFEAEPGLLMYFYDQSGFVGKPGPGPLNEIRVAYIRVQRARAADRADSLVARAARLWWTQGSGPECAFVVVTGGTTGRGRGPRRL